MVALHMAASTQDRTYNNFGEILTYFTDREDVAWLLFGGRESSKVGKEIPHLYNYATQLSFRENAAMVKHCTCAVAVDSVVMHFCDLAKVPTLCLLGLFPHTWTKPTGPHMEWLEARGMDAINPQDIIRWLEKRLTT